MKARETEQKKADKAASAPPKPQVQKKTSAEDDESDLNANVQSSSEKLIMLY